MVHQKVQLCNPKLQSAGYMELRISIVSRSKPRAKVFVLDVTLRAWLDKGATTVDTFDQ